MIIETIDRRGDGDKKSTRTAMTSTSTTTMAIIDDPARDMIYKYTCRSCRTHNKQVEALERVSQK